MVTYSWIVEIRMNKRTYGLINKLLRVYIAVSLIRKSPFGPRREKTCKRASANNTGTDQPAHPRSLISAFVIHFLENIICKLATGEISIF